MLSTTIFPGRYVQGSKAIDSLGEELARLGQKAFAVCDPYIYDNLPEIMHEQHSRKMEIQTERFGEECSDEEIQRLTELAGKAKSDIIVGIGGGKTLDTAKAVAYELKTPVTVVPTIASTDAPCSALAVIYTAKGTFKRYLVLPRNPDLVLVDTRIIADAPTEFLVAGMGDALATWFEAESCKKKFAPNITGNIGSATAYALAHLCYETLIEYGVAAKKDCEVQAVTMALERIVEANTLLSGLGFESGGLAAAHAIHNGLTVLPSTHRFYHGQKVAFGTLTSLVLTEKPQQMIDEVYTFCEAVGLPTTFGEIGLLDASDADLMKVAKAACAKGETIHNEPMPVTPELVLDGMKAADAEGRRRQRLLAPSTFAHPTFATTEWSNV